MGLFPPVMQNRSMNRSVEVERAQMRPQNGLSVPSVSCLGSEWGRGQQSASLFPPGISPASFLEETE